MTDPVNLPVPSRMDMMPLDSIDLAILAILQENGRITNARLAIEVGLSESACFNRVRRLEQSRVILGYQAALAQKAFGTFIEVLADVILESHKHQALSHFEQIVKSIPEIVECIATTGQVDYRLKIIAFDMDDYVRVMNLVSDRHGGLSQFVSTVVMKNVKLNRPLIRGGGVASMD